MKKNEFLQICYNEETGKTEYRIPMELTPETERDFKDKIKFDGYQICDTKFGNRKIRAVLVPVDELVFKMLRRDEMNAQDEERRQKRCMISNGKGGLKRCPSRIPNPDYVVGGSMPKTLPVRCEECPFNTFDKPEFRNVFFSTLATIDDEGETTEFEAEAGNTYNQGNTFEHLGEQFIDYVKKNEPRCVDFARLLVQEYSQAEAALELGKSKNTLSSQQKKLRKAALDFLDTIITM